jgi:hypothetical protein
MASRAGGSCRAVTRCRSNPKSEMSRENARVLMGRSKAMTATFVPVSPSQPPTQDQEVLKQNPAGTTFGESQPKEVEGWSAEQLAAHRCVGVPKVAAATVKDDPQRRRSDDGNLVAPGQHVVAPPAPKPPAAKRRGSPASSGGPSSPSSPGHTRSLPPIPPGVEGLSSSSRAFAPEWRTRRCEACSGASGSCACEDCTGPKDD